MKKLNKFLILSIIPVVMLTGCESESEKIQREQAEQLAKNKEVCEQQIKSGAGATPYCLDILPNYKGLVVQGSDGSVQSAGSNPSYTLPPQPEQVSSVPPVSQAPVVQYVPQPIAAPSQPVIVNQDHNNGFVDGMMGGMMGSMIANGINGGGGTREIHHYNNGVPYGSDNRPITINKTYVTQAPKSSAPSGSSARLPKSTQATTPSVPKKNYMDTSKFGSVGLKPSAPVSRPSSYSSFSRSFSSRRR